MQWNELTTMNASTRPPQLYSHCFITVKKPARSHQLLRMSTSQWQRQQWETRAEKLMERDIAASRTPSNNCCMSKS